MKISVIGAGSWGTVLTQILKDNGHEVALWVRSAGKAEEIAASRCNKSYLPDLQLDRDILITNDLLLAVKRAEVLVFVVPSHGMQDICRCIYNLDTCKNKILLSCTKGFDTTLQLSMSKVINRIFPVNKGIAVMSGPNLAKELALRQPGATVIACDKLEVAKRLQGCFINGYFRPYISEDVTGVELCGCLKNCIALTSGMLFGLNFGENCQAALITRGLAEITRLGMALGAKTATFSGLAGVGDLIATCTSKKSRNRSAGEALARGKTLQEVIAATNMVIEGINTTKVAYALAEAKGVEMPIIHQLYQVLFYGKNVHSAIQELMQRQGKKE